MTFQGHRPSSSFRVAPQAAPNGRRYLWLGHGHGNAETEAGSDARETQNGFVTVTPLRADLTAHEMLDSLGATLNDGR